MSRACPVLSGERHSVFWETRALLVAFLQSPGWLRDQHWFSQRHLKSKFILEAEMLRTQPKNRAPSRVDIRSPEGAGCWETAGGLNGTQMMAFVICFYAVSLLKARQVSMSQALSSTPPQRLGLSTQPAPGTSSRVRGATSMATPRAVWEDGNHSLRRDLSRAARLPTHHNPPRAHQYHRPERGKKKSQRA